MRPPPTHAPPTPTVADGPGLNTAPPKAPSPPKVADGPVLAGRDPDKVRTGGIDVDARACRDFYTLNGVTQACVDLFSLQQYLAWHGNMPPEGWREASAEKNWFSGTL